MSRKQWLVLAASVFLPLAATAQQKTMPHDPSDANAPAGAVSYESIFQTYRSHTAEEQTPDTIWRAANDEMGQLGGHAGHMKGSTDQPDAITETTTVRDNKDRSADHTHSHQGGRQ